MSTLFTSKHQSLSALLLYALGDRAHRATVIRGPKNKVHFVFRDEPRGSCEEIKGRFFSEEGAVVENARELLECARKISQSITACIQNGGTWENSE